MDIVLKPSGFWKDVKDILIKKDGKTLKMLYGGNGDLYLDIFGGETTKNEQGLDESRFVFNAQEEGYVKVVQLYESIIGAKVYEAEEDACSYDKLHAKRLNQMVANGRAYRELVKDGIIEFYSDNIYNERANKLEISKEDNNIIFNFINNPKDPSGYGFSIRVCNSGSKYTPFNVCFMRLFNSFQIEEQQEKE